MNEDEILNKITRLLERGCTMLSTHHECGAPLFRCQGEIVCPVCSFPDKPTAENEQSAAAKSQVSDSMRSGWEAASEGVDREVGEVKARLRASLIARLDEVSGAIRSEGDLDRLKKLLDCAEGLLSVLRKL